MRNSHISNSARLLLLTTVTLAWWSHPASFAAALSITYIQGNFGTPQTPQTTVKVTYTAAQVAGDLNIVVVGWNDSRAVVSAVKDSRGNVYATAVGPTVQSGYASQSIYYAKNIASAAAGTNTVTVTFASAATAPDIRILEYSGADPSNPVDVTGASSGNSNTSSSGSAKTTNPTDLMFGANLVQTITSGPGSGFTSRMLTTPDGDIAEDRMLTATGSYSASAPVSPSGPWIMQVVAFRTPSGGTTSTTASSVSPNSGPTAGGTAVTITGTNFAAGATVTFGGTAATNVVMVSGTQITATTPAGNAGAVTVTVTVNGQSGSLANAFSYTPPPTVSGVSPNSGSTAGGTAVTITGTNFAAGATVTFAGTAATNVVVVSGTQITGTTPAGSAGAAAVTVTNPGAQSGSLANGFSYAVATNTAITYVQGNFATPQTPQTAVKVMYTAAQVIGDLNVVVVGWNDSTAAIGAVTDSSGNAYARAVGPTVQSGYASQSIYYAKNIAAAAAGTNIVTVTFASAATAPDIRILEYSGADPSNPLDVTVASSGNSATSSSGSAGTTNATDLILGANLVQTETTGPGSGSTERLLTTPDGDIAEDQMVTSIGSYSATAPVSPSGPWIMQMVAFRTTVTCSNAPPAAPGNLAAAAESVSQINLSWAASFSCLGIAHYVVQRCQGSGCTNFAQIATPAGTNYNDTVLLPSTSYSYQVQAVDTAGNTSAFSNSATAATQAPQPPTAPSNLTATAASASQINLSWTASTSNVGLANYIVQRCQGADCTNFAQIATPAVTSYSDTGLLLSTSYSYQVQAIDMAGNPSPYSSVASATTGSLLPLKASSNNRYLVGQNGTPFLIMGDAPQSLVGNVSPSDMATYMADRERLGFNSLWVNLLCANYTYCNSNGTTYDGVTPFTSGSSPSDYDLSTPNTAYFSRVDSMVNLALTYNLVVFLDPIETGGWLVTLENNGSAKAYNYGVYIGNRYKTFANIVWLHGNDFQSWSSSSTDNNLVKQVMAGIASVDSNHLQTIELNYNSSYSSQDSALGSVLTLDSAYTYYETYDMVLQSYNSSPTIPTYLVESNYEYENNTGALPGSAGPYVLREQAYWTMLSGGAGQLYGNHYTVTFTAGWQSYLDSPGGMEIQYINQLFGSVAWWELVPDSTHEIVTSGYGTYDGSNENFTTATYCTTSWITSGSLALTYCPNGSTLTVDLAKFSGPVTAQWYDPSNGTYTAVPGSPFPNSGTQYFSTPGNNHDGNADWVLELHI